MEIYKKDGGDATGQPTHVDWFEIVDTKANQQKKKFKMEVEINYMRVKTRRPDSFRAW